MEVCGIKICSPVLLTPLCLYMCLCATRHIWTIFLVIYTHEGRIKVLKDMNKWFWTHIDKTSLVELKLSDHSFCGKWRDRTYTAFCQKHFCILVLQFAESLMNLQSVAIATEWWALPKSLEFSSLWLENWSCFSFWLPIASVIFPGITQVFCT